MQGAGEHGLAEADGLVNPPRRFNKIVGPRVVIAGDESGSRSVQSEKAGMHQGVGKARR
jgi:hypothetical protein